MILMMMHSSTIQNFLNLPSENVLWFSVGGANDVVLFIYYVGVLTTHKSDNSHI